MSRIKSLIKAIAAGSTLLALTPAVSLGQANQWEVIENYCYQCHNDEDWAGSVAFNLMSSDDIAHEAEIWEEAIRRLAGGHMPPPGNDRPPEAELQELVSWLEDTIDASAGKPPAGNVPLRRLNVREYENAIRDLLALEVGGAVCPRRFSESNFFFASPDFGTLQRWR